MNKILSLFVRKPVKTISAADTHLVEVEARVLATLEEAIREKRVTSRLAANANNKGDLSMDGGLQVIGTHEGKITITGGHGVVWISETGVVIGDIEAPHVYIQGRVHGKIRSNLTIIEGRGMVEGVLATNNLMQRNIKNITMHVEINPRDEEIDPSISNVVNLIPDPSAHPSATTPYTTTAWAPPHSSVDPRAGGNAS